MTVSAFIVSMWHDRLMRRVLYAFVAYSTAAVLFAGIVGATQQKPVRRLDRADWPRCVLVTELAAQTVMRRGHSLVFREVKGQNHGRMYFDGHYVGLGANLRASWMACATWRILAPFDGVRRY